MLTSSRPFRYSENNDNIGSRKLFITLAILRKTPNLYLIHPHGSSTLPLSAQQETKTTTSKSHLSELKLSALSLYSPCKIRSKKFPHSFEKQAIMGTINASRIKHPGPNGMNEKAARSSVCEVVSGPFTSSDLHNPRRPKSPPTNSRYSNLITTHSFSPLQTSLPILPYSIE